MFLFYFMMIITIFMFFFSSKMAISSLVLLQTSPVIMRRSKPNCHPLPERIDAMTDSEEVADNT